MLVIDGGGRAQKRSLRGSGRPPHVLRRRRGMAIALAAVLMLAARTHGRRMDVACHNVDDTALLIQVIRSSARGDSIHISGTCRVNQTIPLLGGRSYSGSDTDGSRIVQADGANLPALAASEAWLGEHKAPDLPTRIAHLTLDGNSQANVGTHALVLQAWQVEVYDVCVLNAPEDAIRVTSLRAEMRKGGRADQPQSKNHFSKLFIERAGNIGFHVVDDLQELGVINGHLLDSWVSTTGGSGVLLGNAAGWQVRGVHTYDSGEHAIIGLRCSGSSFTENYIEDYGHFGTPRSRTAASTTVLDEMGAKQSMWHGRMWYGLACYLLPGADEKSATVMAHNRIFNDMTGKYTKDDGNTTVRIFAALAVPDIVDGQGEGVPTGRLVVTGNAIAGGNRRFTTGEMYNAGNGKVLQVSSKDNQIFGVRRLRNVEGRVSFEPEDGASPALIEPEPENLKRDPCCPLANPSAFHKPFQHGDWYTPGGTTGPIYSYIAFDKVGSTLMRKILMKRQANISPACFNYLEQRPKRSERPPPICDMHEISAESCYAKSCDFTVTQIDGMKHETLNQFCGGAHTKTLVPRPCYYFTLLRDPVARLHSAHAYFCLACKENGRQCAGNKGERWGYGSLPCPNMTVVEYARYFGNVYTRSFSAKSTLQATGGIQAPSVDAEKADHFLQQIFVMLEPDLANPSPFRPLADWMDDPMSSHLSQLDAPQVNQFASASGKKAHHHAEDPEVSQALAEDIWLYERVLARRGQTAAEGRRLARR
jgi:hypothetical protein